MIAFVEESRVDSLTAEVVYRYEMPTLSFEDIGDAGMWVCAKPQRRRAWIRLPICRKSLPRAT